MLKIDLPSFWAQVEPSDRLGWVLVYGNHSAPNKGRKEYYRTMSEAIVRIGKIQATHESEWSPRRIQVVGIR
jgi:hypothetical protein